MSGPRHLDELLRKIRTCRVCVDTPRGDPLPHLPRPVLRLSNTARICICGQAPGTRVHASGVPFTDPSGERLREWLGIDSDTFYDESRIAIVPMGFCFPGQDAKGGDLPPRKECAPTWRPSVFAELPNLKLLLLVGKYAQNWHLEDARKRSLTETVRSWRIYVEGDDGVVRVPMPHPSWRNSAWLKKNRWFADEVLPFVQKRVADLLS